MGNTDAPILFATRKWAPATGGMETYCLRLTEALGDHAKLQVIALGGGKNGMPPGPMALLLFPFTFIAACLRRSSAPRVLHLGDMAIWPFGLVCWFWSGTQLVLSAHGTDVAYHRRGGLKGRLYGAYLKLGARLLGKRARVVANSRATSDVTKETGWRDIVVVPLASDLPSPQKPSAPSRTILFAGRLVRRKGCAWFIRKVLPLLPDDVTLDVAGTVWDEDERAALDHKHVRFLGPVPQEELARRYAEALCVVVPNIDAGNGEYEGFGLIAPEAAAAGGIVLAADHGGLKDAVIDGETGYLLPSEDHTRWAEAIASVAGWPQEQRASFTSRASSTAREHYSWKRVARETYTAYDLAEMPRHKAEVSAASPLVRFAAPLGQAKAALTRFKKPLLGLALMLFAGGSILSVSRLDLNFAAIDTAAIAILLLLLAPLGIVYGALNMVVMGRGAGVTVSSPDAMRISAFSQVAEFLPIPGGALVRGGALIQRGVRTIDAAAHVTANAILWIACAAFAAGMSIGANSIVGGLLALSGFLGLSACLIWLNHKAGRTLAITAVFVRSLGLALIGARILFAFAVIGYSVEIMDTYVFAFATIAGSASAIAPGGLGVSEALAGIMATLSTLPPEAAFLAVGIDRIAGLIASGATSLAFIASSRPAEATGS